MRRRGFLGGLLAAPAALLLRPKAALAKRRPALVWLEGSGGVEQHDLGAALGMKTREVANVKYEWFTTSGPEHNYLQIVRTPVGWAGRRDPTAAEWAAQKEWALAEHLKTIRSLLSMGRRHSTDGRYGARTFTGGRHFFGTTDEGRVAYLRSRGLVWRLTGDPGSDSESGEWLSDIGWAP